MRDLEEKIREILAREISRLDALSQTAGLSLDDTRQLDLLLKSVKTYHSKDRDKEFDPANPAKQTTEELLAAITLPGK